MSTDFVQWLTTGRNNCPMCRGQGVKEQARDRDLELDVEQGTNSGALARDGNLDADAMDADASESFA